MASDSEQSNDTEFSLPPHLRRRRLWKYFRPYLKWFIAGAIFLVFTNLMTLAIPQQLGDAVQALRDAVADDSLDVTAVHSQVIGAAVVIIVLAIGAGIARVFSRITIFNACRYIEFDLRNTLYDHLSKLTPNFYGSMPTGDLTSRTTNDVKYVRLLYAIPYLHIVNTAVAYSIAVYRMVGVDWRLTLACLIPYPFLLLGIRKVIYALFLQTKVVQSQLSDLSTHIQENLCGIDVVKAYVLEGRETERYGEENETYFRENLELAKIRALLNALIVLIASTGTLIVLIVGSRFVVDGTMSLGDFVEFNAYVVALVPPTIALGWVFAIWHRGLAAFDRVSELLEHEPELDDPDDPASLPDPAGGGDVGEIVFDDVTFSYDDDDQQALEDVSLHIPAGSTVAVVGKTGSGKSTLVRLIARLYDPDSGEIRIDGVPNDQIDLRTLRSEVGFVPQEPFLFSMTVGDNIRFGLDSLAYDSSIEKSVPDDPLLGAGESYDGEFTQHDRIEEAVDIAALRGDIDGFNEGLETLVGERGVTLSGGQKQRVTIARALLVDPRILVLDDALASVDTHTERRILHQLETIMEGRTSIMLTHRFNALAEVDRIFVLDDGKLVEQGTHEELVERDGVYADMYRRQKLREQFDQ